MSLRRTRRSAVVAVTVGFGLVAAACGGGGGDDSSTVIGVNKDDIGASATTAVAIKEPTTMEEWEKLWEKERAAVVAKIKADKSGISADGKSVQVAPGYTVDLSKCSAGWNNTEGLTDTTIKVGQSIAQSGTLADYGNYGKSIDVLFKYYSEKGLFKDANGKTRKVEYVQKDDGYDANRAIPNVDELLDSTKVFMLNTLGTPATLKVVDKVNSRCVPHPFVMTAHPAWGDPVNRAWTTGAPVASYTTETLFWGDFVEKKFAEFGKAQITVTALVMNNDFGKVYNQGFKEYLANSAALKGKVNFVTEQIEPTAPTITDAMTTLASKNPDIHIAMTAGTSCTQSNIEAAANGMKGKVKYLIYPNTCSGNGFIGKDKVGGDGAAGDGWLIFEGGIKEIKDTTKWAKDPWQNFLRAELQKAGINPDSSSLLGGGAAYAWPWIQITAIAGQLDGGLTRANFLVAMRNFSMTPPTHFWGIKSELSGNKDGYVSEAAVLSKFNSKSQLWEPQGDVVDLNGKSKNCAWDIAAGNCKA